MHDDRHFWRNLILIALAHILVLGAVFWFARERKNAGGSSGGEPVWMDPATFVAENKTPPKAAEIPEPPPDPTPEPTPDPTPENTPLPETITSDEGLQPARPTPTPTPEEKKPTPTPRPTSRPTPRPTARPKPTPRPTTRPKPTPRPTSRPKPTPGKTPEAAEEKAERTPRPQSSATPAASSNASESPIPRAEPVEGQVPRAQPVSPGTGAGLGTRPSEGGEGTGSGTGRGSGSSSGVSLEVLNDYRQVIQNRFTGAWEQPLKEAQSGQKFVVSMRIVINKDGTISSFNMVRSSGSEIVDASVQAAVESVTRLSAPPTGKMFTQEIDFALNN